MALPTRWYQYTDGAWDGENAEEDMPDLRAGWGVASLEVVPRDAPGALATDQVTVQSGALVESSQFAKLSCEEWRRAR